MRDSVKPFVRSPGAALLGGAAALALLSALPLELEARQDPPGKAVYDQWCAGCHGVDGLGYGDGAHTMLPRPRDFTRAMYQIRTTGSGELPTDADILLMIDKGMPGTGMPGWEDVLTRQQRNELVTYLKSFSVFFEMGPAPVAMRFGRAPRASEERIEEGRQVYQQLECWQCHGQEGRGDGNSSTTLTDDMDFPVVARDLTRNWLFDGGGAVADIYQRVMTGLDGTPMATFKDAVDGGVVTDDQMWSLAHYVRSLSPGRAPAVQEVIPAALIEDGPLPSSPDDPLWDEAASIYVPLVGQIVLAPRWFNPRVDGIWVEALHDRQELAIRVSWTDPSRSPDPEWGEWAEMVREAMEPHDPGADWQPGAPDQLVIQFPQQLPRGMERPYFIQGDGRRPTVLWQWRSDGSPATELVARGMGTGQPRPAGETNLRAESTWSDGQWRVVFRRPVTTADETGDIQFPMERTVPIAFQAWDGDNGESGGQASISTWYFIQLQERTPATVYVAPVLAMLLTAGLGLLVVARAQKREREGESGSMS